MGELCKSVKQTSMLEISALYKESKQVESKAHT